MSPAWLAGYLVLTGPAANEDKPAEDDDEGEVRKVVVTGTRTERKQSEAPVATQVYDRREIEDSGAENLAEVMQETPGVQMSPGLGGMGIRMQGLDPEYTVILIDGQRTTGRVDNTMDLSRFPAEEIEQIEVVRGPSSVLYGADALAGTVNLITRKPTKPQEGEVHVAYGSFNTVDLSARAGLARRWYAGQVTGGWHRTDGWDADPSDIATTGPSINQWNLASTHDFGDFGPFSIRARGSYLRRDSHRINATETGAVFDRRNRSEVVTATLRPRLDWGRSRLTLLGGYNLWRDQFLDDQRGSTELDQTQDTFDHLGQSTIQYDHEIGKHVLTIGGDGQFEVLRTDRIDPRRVDRQRYAIFVQDEWTPVASPKFVVLPGARLDYDTLFGLYPTPRIALMLVPTKRWTFRASYGRGYRAPAFREMFLLFANPGAGYQVTGSPGLKPETSWSASFSAEVRPWKWMWLAANVFDNRISDAIVIDLSGTQNGLMQFIYTNVGEATTRGVEGQASVSILKSLTLDGSYTYVYTFDHEARRPLPGRAPHSGTAGLRFFKKPWGTGFRVRSSILGRRVFFDANDNEIISAPFATLDARLSQRFLRYVQVFVGVDNILDAGNATDNPIQPRTYYGGATVRY